MRLIDADELKEELASHFDVELEPLVEKEVLRMIDEQETILVKPPKWTSVKDRSPEDDRDVLAVSNGKVLIANYLDGESVMVANYLDGWVRYVEDECGDMEPTGIDVSYWMEMPEPPEVEDGAV